MPEVLANLQTYSKYGKIAICQTNGKKTITHILNQIIEANDKTYITNVASNAKKYPPLTSIILNLIEGGENFLVDSEKDYYTMAMDEFELDSYFNSMRFDYLHLGNLFVDQRDFISLEEKREKIQKAIMLNSKLSLIINADDPMFHKIDEIKNDTILSKKRSKFYYGFNKIEYGDKASFVEQKNDILKCPNCACKLDYRSNYSSHLGFYDCECGFRRPILDLSAEAKIFSDYVFLTCHYKDNKMVFKLPFGGLHNAYNALGAIAIALNLGVERKIITDTFENYRNLKGRDDLFVYKDKQIKIKTIKNPVSLSSCLRELYGNKNTKVVFCLNDAIEDGFDTSWIWDANFNSMTGFENKIYVSSNRFDDMALRLKYANVNPSLIVMDASVRNAIQCCYWDVDKNETMLILTTPSLIDTVYDILKK